AHGESLSGRRCVVSGAGNVAISAIQKLEQLGAEVVACSDTGGYVHDPRGIDLALLKQVKQGERGRIEEYARRRGGNARFVEGAAVWELPCELAFPCATQNELDGRDARTLVKNGARAVVEGANMPCTPARSEER